MPTIKKNSRKAPAEMVHPEYDVEVWDGASPLTEEWAEKFLGWLPEKKYVEQTLAAMPEKKRGKAKVSFGEDYDFKDAEGEKVRCMNNRHNRPLDMSWARIVAQIILNKQWRLNGETIVIGQYGSVLSGQHRLIGFKLACQMRRSQKQKYHWEEVWDDKPITIDVTIAKGVSEDQDVVNTLDNNKPRTISDVLFSDENLFGPGLSRTDRIEICKATENAIKFLWKRTGADRDKFSGNLTNQEAVSFLARHSTLKDAVRIICAANAKEGDNTNGIGAYSSLGVAAGMLYLMGCSATDDDRNQWNQLISYADMDPMPSEKKLNWERWEQAVNFWKGFGSGAEEFSAIRFEITDTKSPDPEEMDGTLQGSMEAWTTGIFALAWQRYLEGETLEADPDGEVQKTVRPPSEKKEDGFRTLTEVQFFGGIDALGNGKKKGPDFAEPKAEEEVENVEEVIEKAEEEEDFSVPEDEGEVVEEVVEYPEEEIVEEEAPPVKPKRAPRKKKAAAK